MIHVGSDLADPDVAVLAGRTVALAYRGEPDADPRVARCLTAAQDVGMRVVHLQERRLGPCARGVAAYTRRALPRPLAEMRSAMKAGAWLGRSRLTRDSFDIVHAHELPVLPWALRLARHHAVPCVYDAHELYSRVEPCLERSRWIEMLEGWLTRRVAAVVVPDLALGRQLESRVGRPLPLSVVRNTSPGEGRRPRFGAGPLRVVYAGSLQADRELPQVLCAASATPEMVVTVFSTSGRGPIDATCEWRDPVPRTALPRILSDYDIGLVPLRASAANHAVALPNKVFDYLAGALAIVSGPSAPIRDLVVTGGAGVEVLHGRWAATLRDLASDRGRVDRMRRAAHRLAGTVTDAEERRRLVGLWARLVIRRA